MTNRAFCRIMAVINVSPESFHKASVAEGEAALVAAVRKAEAEGAAMIDVGAMSTAPYHEVFIPEDEERRRMAWAVRILHANTGLPISADTQRLSVAEAAIAEGATWINDVTALQTAPGIGPLCARTGTGLILMASEHGLDAHRSSSPVETVIDLLTAAAERAAAAGVSPARIILDPGIGFFRSQNIPWHQWDLEILRRLESIECLGFPVLVGASRKSLFKELLGRNDPADRLAGSLAVAAWCHRHRIGWLRVHDVRETADVFRTLDLLNSPEACAT